MTPITEHLSRLKTRISKACDAAGRDPAEISILPVSKKHNIRAIELVAAEGLTDFGENYVNEAVAKMRQTSLALNWHFIGRVQSNKTRVIAENFAWVQTVSSEKIALRLSQQRPATFAPLQVLIQVQMDSDGAHGGVQPAAARELARYIRELPGLKLRGFMGIPMPAEDTQAQREPFRQLKLLFDEMLNDGHPIDTLSMGMSNDMEAAIMEGSTMIRIGTALFGERS